MITTVLISIAVGLIVNEFCDVSPWLARKIARWSAFRRYHDWARAESRAEELAAVINDRPGKLFKLITACGFAFAASLTDSLRHRVMLLIRLVIGGAFTASGTAGVISGVMSAAANLLTTTQVVGQTCMALTWVIIGVIIAVGRRRGLSLIFDTAFGLAFGLGCAANIAFYLYGSDVGHLVGAAFWFGLVLATAALALMARRDDRRWHRYQELHAVLYPDCSDCIFATPSELEQRTQPQPPGR